MSYHDLVQLHETEVHSAYNAKPYRLHAVHFTSALHLPLFYCTKYVMFSLRAFGLCSSLRTLRPTAANTRHAATKATPTRCLSSLLRQTSSQHVWRRIHARAQSTQASKGAKTGGMCLDVH